MILALAVMAKPKETSEAFMVCGSTVKWVEVLCKRCQLVSRRIVNGGAKMIQYKRGVDQVFR